MAIVKTDVPQTSELCNNTILELVKIYPFLRTELLTETAFGRKIRTLVIGKGKRKVIYSAAHHANEWICGRTGRSNRKRWRNLRNGRKNACGNSDHLFGTHGKP